MRKLLAVIGVLIFLAAPAPAAAVCPVCTVAVAGGLGFSRWLGIDDLISGVWIGGLILSSGLWLAGWVKKKTWKLPLPELFSVLLMVVFVFPPLYWSKMINLKIIWGTVLGSLVFSSGIGLDQYLRKINHNQVYIYYQKVIIPVLLLTLISYIVYYVRY